MTEDKEIETMQLINEALKDLDKETIGRILRWVTERYGVSTSNRRQMGISEREGEAEYARVLDIASLFDLASPKLEWEKALVVGYWLQQVQGQAELESQQINTQLKHLGHGVSNITDCMSSLMNMKPALAIQTHKSGKSKQARKKYKITREGIRRVEAMLKSAQNDDDGE